MHIGTRQITLTLEGTYDEMEALREEIRPILSADSCEPARVLDAKLALVLEQETVRRD